MSWWLFHSWVHFLFIYLFAVPQIVNNRNASFETMNVLDGDGVRIPPYTQTFSNIYF
jgi:hypothetical protein